MRKREMGMYSGGDVGDVFVGVFGRANGRGSWQLAAGSWHTWAAGLLAAAGRPHHEALAIASQLRARRARADAPLLNG